jgi:hypothetical protein
MTGYPSMADPQMMFWYPLTLFLRLLPGSWNAFIVLAYILASWFMYLFVRCLTGRDLAGLGSGLIFGLCGFMNAHLQHVTIIHTALWIPAILLCLERLADGVRGRWMAFGSLATGACVLAGHPQIALYGLSLALGYLIVRGFSAAKPRWRYYAAGVFMLGAGVALSAIQTLPATELARVTNRATLSFADFTAYALRPNQLITILFPWLSPGADGREVAGYVGLSGLILATIAAIRWRTLRVSFWVAAMAISFVAAMGSATPFGRLLYALPGFGQFRAPGRFLLLFGISVAVLAGYGLAAITWPALRAALVVVVIAELTPFFWNSEWRSTARAAADFAQPDIIRRVGPLVRQAQARWVPIRGDQGKLAEAPGDLPLLWQLPSLSKYGPLLPVRYQELLKMQANSQFRGQWWEPANRALDITGGRFIAVPETRPGDELPLAVGRGCGADVPATEITLSPPRAISGLALVTYTGCSAGIAQGTPVAEVHVAPDGVGFVFQLHAGIETAEWAAGCADVAPQMRHRAGEVYARHTVPRGGSTCQAQTYTAVLHLPQPTTVTGIRFHWLPAGSGVLKVDAISLLDAKTGERLPLSAEDVRFGDPTRWKRLDPASGVGVYENLRAQPRVWLVPETLTAPPEQIVQAIQTSSLPGGGLYDPAALALIEEPLAFRGTRDSNAKATLLRDTGSAVEIRASSHQPAFLVLGDFYYPGWRATVNGRPAHIYQTNYIQRGVLLPPGDSLVRFEFRPASFYTGAAISLCTLALIAGIALFAVARHGRGSARHAVVLSVFICVHLWPIMFWPAMSTVSHRL